jgi:hypothetical protein
MTAPETAVKVTDYKILFDQLEKARNEQPAEVQLSLEQDEELNETMALFSEFQNSELAASFSTITVG